MIQLTKIGVHGAPRRNAHVPAVVVLLIKLVFVIALGKSYALSLAITYPPEVKIDCYKQSE